MAANLIKEFELFDSDILKFNSENQTKEDFFENIGCIVDWKSMCQFSKLKEDFLRKHIEKIEWKYVSANVNIIFSEDFIFEFKDKLNVTTIILRKKNSSSSEYVQQFSIGFIESIQKYVNWFVISGRYDLSENFIDKFIDDLDLRRVISRVNLSDEFIKKHESKLRYYVLSEKEKIRQVLNHGYTIIGKNKEKWVECYKAVRNNYASIYAGDNYIYNKVDYTYETDCDYCVLNENSFGFGCWTQEKAILFGLQIYDSRLIKVVVPLKNLCILPNGKIRSSKMIITDLSVIRNIETLRYNPL